MEKLTKKEILKELHSNTGLSQRLLSQILDTLLKELEIALDLEEEIKISGFGTFKTVLSKPRKGRKLKSGEEVIVAPFRKVSFHLSPTFRLELHNEKGKK
ncbi:MAG: HU family DNA-binding protein [Thermodesulfobacteriaceae bacterium]|nr:HU family DNA-binding protein [Thermodesulfobacteriaceae bacterium]